MDTPQVTILTATYNRDRYIMAAIESAQAQTFTDWELLVLDDGSTDDTAAIVHLAAMSDKRIKYIKQPKNLGIPRNKNVGVGAAKGEFIAILDSDDVWTDPSKLEEQVKFLRTHQEFALVGSQVTVIDEDGKTTGKFSYKTSDKAIRSNILSRNQFAHSSVLYRANEARAVGGYDESYAVNDDYDLWLKLGSKYKFANLPTQTTGYRTHTSGITKTRRKVTAQEHIDIIKKYRGIYPRYFFAFLKARLRLLIAC